MRTIFFGWMMLLLLLNSSCAHNHEEDERMCTMEYKMLTITVLDSLSNPVLLDESRVLKTGTGITIDFTQENPYQDSLNRLQGVYTLFTDGKMSLTAPSGTEFRFTGKQGGKTVVDEPYIIGNDRCHIVLISGKPVITIRQFFY